LKLEVPSDQLEPLYASLQLLGTIGIEERPCEGEWAVRQPWEADLDPVPLPPRIQLLAWFEQDEASEERIARMGAVLSELPGATMTPGTLSEGDWEERWRSTFQPFQLGSGLVIAPPWDPRPGALLVEPALAFGTGLHPTTRACLEAVARLAIPGRSLLDVGCGTGLLALAGARHGMRCEGVDNDPDAVRASRANALLNDLPCRFDSRPLTALAGRYHLVLANVYAEVLVQLSADLRRLTSRHLVVAGILADRAASVEQALRPLAPVRKRRDGEWVSMELQRP